MEIHLSNTVREHNVWFKAEGGTENGIEINRQASDLRILMNRGNDAEKIKESQLTEC